MSVTFALRAASESVGLRLAAHAVAVPALASMIRPALVLPERETRALLHAAMRRDVSGGGCFSAGPAGIQVWSGPFDGPGGSHGSAVHLGSVDWTYDTPVRHYVTVYRSMVTAAGVESGDTPNSVLARVLALTGVEAIGTTLTMPTPPAADPFRSSTQRQRTA
ncbi:MAG: hypothetical protein M3Z02_08865 [Actinomycetota bacterium]|nr:hypothetical protein [Actinomycetota bacterium]